MVITSGQYLPFVVLQLYCYGLLAAIWLMRYVASSGSCGVCIEIDFTEKNSYMHNSRNLQRTYLPSSLVAVDYCGTASTVHRTTAGADAIT